MPGVGINWWALLMAALVNIAIGAVWFSPRLFGARKAQVKAAQPRGVLTYTAIMVASLIQTWIFVHFVRYAGSITFWEGVVTGFWLWLGLVVITGLIYHLFENRNRKLWRIYAGYFLLTMLINGGLLAAWR